MAEPEGGYKYPTTPPVAVGTNREHLVCSVEHEITAAGRPHVTTKTYFAPGSEEAAFETAWLRTLGMYRIMLKDMGLEK